MKKTIILIAVLVILLIAIPIISVMLTGGVFERENGNDILVYIVSEDRTEKMDREYYLKGVVAAEMPVEFELEALKAQAVAARTYLEARINRGASDEHKGAVICTDYKHCAAWISENDRKASWEAEKADEYWNKISKAVDETRGEILTFNGKTISAVFHSTSSGKTEAAADVWGKEVEYLVSVESPQDELSPKFYAEKEVSVEEFKNTVLEKYDNADVNAPLFEKTKVSNSGGCITVNTLGISMKGTEFRTLFDLRSTNIEFSEENEKVIIKTKGYGHGVGMSQYGASYMAKQGSGYRDILAHYYKGTVLAKALD